MKIKTFQERIKKREVLVIHPEIYPFLRARIDDDTIYPNILVRLPILFSNRRKDFIYLKYVFGNDFQILFEWVTTSSFLNRFIRNKRVYTFPNELIDTLRGTPIKLEQCPLLIEAEKSTHNQRSYFLYIDK